MNTSTKRLVGVSLALTFAFSAVVFAKTVLFGPRKGIAVKTGSSGYKEWREKPEEKSEEKPEEKSVRAAAVQDIQPAEPAVEKAAETGEAAADGKININTASAEVLEQLPGIGEYLARTIVGYRTENGDFEKIEDIMKVSGIGPSKYKGIADFISVGDR